MTMHVNFKMRYLQHWTDELGRKRYRFRRKGYPGCELPVNADPNSPEFQAAYHAALRGEKTNVELATVAARGGSGTVGDAIERWLASTTFRDSAQSTQSQRKPILKRFLQAGVGNLPLVRMDAKYLERWLETAPTVNAKRNWLSALKPFTAWAVSPMSLIETDPAAGLKVKTFQGDGHWTWLPEEIEQFRAHHPLGSKARLALELFLTLTTRRGDGIALGPQHRKGNLLSYTQGKNRRRKPVKIEVPMPAELVAAIEACPSPPESMTFLTNEWGRPYREKAFNTAFRGERCVPHGLRKGGSKRLGDAGCTVHEIAAVTGHMTLRMVQHYTAAYDRRQAAARAQAKVAAIKAEAEVESNVVPLHGVK